MTYTDLGDLSPDVGGQVVHVRISRLWHHRGGTEGGCIKTIHMVLIDAQANQMHAIAPYPVNRKLVHVLHEGNVYEISRFLLVLPRPILRPVEATYTMILGASAVVKRNEGNIDDFPTWSYCLTSFAELPLADETPERFVDVIGTISAISNLVVSEVPGRTTDVARRNVYITDPSTEQTIRIVLWGECAYRFNGSTVKFLGQTESAVAIFVGTTVRDYDGQRGLAGGAACRWYINDDIPEINILRVSLLDHSVSIADCPISTATSLRSQIGECPRKSVAGIINFNLFENQNARFRCTVRVLGFTPNHRWFGAFCTRCRRSSSPHPDFPLHESFMCTNPHCDCENAMLSYQIAFVGTDGTDEAEFILRGQVGQRVIGMSIFQLIETNWPPKSPRCNSFRAAARIRFPSPQFAAIISNRYKFIVGVREGSFYRPRPCFEVLEVEAAYVLPKPQSSADLRHPASSSVWA